MSREDITQSIGVLLNVLAELGVLIDPTTKGITDSTRALTYAASKNDLDEVYADDQMDQKDLEG